jgi:ABC-type Fe3+/spermidine/putrescine transport system ATPase subunit
MFDEPLGALDRSLREDLLNELRMILHRTGIPAIYVTHDQEEAFTIADRVLILNEGKIIREGTPADVWTHPQSAYVAEFLGLGNVFDGEVMGDNSEMKTPYGVYAVECSHKHSKGDKAKLLARPFEVRDEAHTIHGIVRDVIFQQDRFKVILDNGLYVYLDKEPRLGEKVSVKVKLECLG